MRLDETTDLMVPENVLEIAVLRSLIRSEIDRAGGFRVDRWVGTDREVIATASAKLTDDSPAPGGSPWFDAVAGITADDDADGRHGVVPGAIDRLIDSSPAGTFGPGGIPFDGLVARLQFAVRARYSADGSVKGADVVYQKAGRRAGDVDGGLVEFCGLKFDATEFYRAD